MKDLAENLFGVLVISMQVSLTANDITFRGKMVTLARIHCQRKDAGKEFQRFAENNPDTRPHATFNFDSDFVA
jgi:hypothetical protein